MTNIVEYFMTRINRVISKIKTEEEDRQWREELLSSVNDAHFNLSWVEFYNIDVVDVSTEMYLYEHVIKMFNDVGKSA